MEALEFLRKADKSAALKVTGHNTFGAFLADLTTPAAAEQAVLELPVMAAYQQPLQAPDGQFYFLPDFSLPEGPDTVL
jgi:hypothetical protein